MSLSSSLIPFLSSRVATSCLSHTRRNLHWGSLAYRRGLVQYAISPYEINAFSGYYKRGFPNMIRRVGEQIFVVLGPLAFYAAIYLYFLKESKAMKRKGYDGVWH